MRKIPHITINKNAYKIKALNKRILVFFNDESDKRPAGVQMELKVVREGICSENDFNSKPHKLRVFKTKDGCITYTHFLYLLSLETFEFINDGFLHFLHHNPDHITLKQYKDVT